MRNGVTTRPCGKTRIPGHCSLSNKNINMFIFFLSRILLEFVGISLYVYAGGKPMF